MAPKYQTLKGFRDFLGQRAKNRLWLTNKIRETFELYGFEPLETPALEYESLLTGKYGAEADKLIYGFEDRGGRRVALRYDQTIPSARVIAQYRNDLVFPYRRYQIQPVWRADKPQKGRYREFVQCDVDVFGSTSPVTDAEILACTYAAFTSIGYPGIHLAINDRQTLISTLAPFATDTLSVFSIIQSIDKLDKISQDDVVSELVSKGMKKSDAEHALHSIQEASMTDNVKDIVRFATSLGVAEDVITFTPTLARGLDYYTGMIFEVTIPGYEVGSVGGGGRYDELIEKLGGVNIPAVGIAFGFDRMIDAAEQFGLLDTDAESATVLVTLFDDASAAQALAAATALRKASLQAEVYPGIGKLDKQLKYANKKGHRFVLIMGPEEVAQKTVQLKDMKTGMQETFTLEGALNKLKQQ